VKLYAAVMVGGAIGSALRYATSTWIAEATHSTFPWGTLAVNVIGSFVIGFFTGLTGPDGPLLVSPVVRAFVTIGILGGFTTFSSFSLQTLLLMEDGQWFSAAGNVVSSVGLCLVAAGAGIASVNVLPGRI
jgi:fluoride exporter